MIINLNLALLNLGTSHDKSLATPPGTGIALLWEARSSQTRMAWGNAIDATEFGSYACARKMKILVPETQ